MEKVFLIGASGYLLSRIYNFRIKKKYSEESNNRKFLILSFVSGIFPYVIVEAMRVVIKFCCPPTYNFFLKNPELMFIAQIILLVIIALTLGIFFSSHCMQKELERLKKFLSVLENEPQTKGLVDYDWKTFTGEEVLIFTLKNSKVYVGYLKYADYSGEIYGEQKAIRILPLKSGVRDKNGIVTYTTHYYRSKNDEVKQDVDVDSVNSLPELVIFQKEIVSYTIFDSALDEYFGHPEEESSHLHGANQSS